MQQCSSQSTDPLKQLTMQPKTDVLLLALPINQNTNPLCANQQVIFRCFITTQTPCCSRSTRGKAYTAPSRIIANLSLPFFSLSHTMGLRQVLRKLSPRNRKPKFQKIVWPPEENGKTETRRPPTRGKQLAPWGFTAPTMDARGMPSPLLVTMKVRSNTSFSSHAPLLTPNRLAFP